MMKLRLLLAIAFAAIPTIVFGWGGSHSGSFSASDGHWSSSGSTSWTSRSGQTYDASHSASGNYGAGWHTGSGSYSNSWGGSGNWSHAAANGYGYHYGATSVNGVGACGGAYHYGGASYGGCYGVGFRAGYVAAPAVVAPAPIVCAPVARVGFYRRW